MADEKLRSIPDGVTTLVGSDGSCLMHLRGRLAHEAELAAKRGEVVNVPAVRHIAEVLAERLPFNTVGANASAPGGVGPNTAQTDGSES